jgi:hypothetical protein
MVCRYCTARVITKDGLTEAFLIEAGVPQGDTLEPYLFVIVIAFIMRSAPEGKDFFGFIRQLKSVTQILQGILLS